MRSKTLKIWILALWCQLFWRPVSGQIVLRPHSFSDLGAHYVQPAYRVTGARLWWMDRQALDRDFESLRHLSDRQVKDWILQNFAYVTETQRLLNGRLTSPMSLESEPAFEVAQPMGYGRASVHLGVDVKGSGLPPEIPEGVEDVLEFFKLLEDQKPASSEMRKAWSFETERLIRYLDVGRKKLRALRQRAHAIDPEARSLEHSLQSHEAILTLYERAIALDDVYRDGDVAKIDESRSELLQSLRTVDYRNGLMGLGDAISEVIRQKVHRSIVYATHLAGSPRTMSPGIDSYFIIELPFEITQTDGQKTSAAIVGRQTSFRWITMTDVYNGTQVRDDIGLGQSDIFGHPVDFERVTFPTLGLLDPILTDDHAILRRARQMALEGSSKAWWPLRRDSQKLMDGFLQTLTKETPDFVRAGSVAIMTDQDALALKEFPKDLSDTDVARIFERDLIGQPRGVVAYQYVTLVRTRPRVAQRLMKLVYKKVGPELFANGIMPAVVDDHGLVQRAFEILRHPELLVRVLKPVLVTHKESLAGLSDEDFARSRLPIVWLWGALFGEIASLGKSQDVLRLFDLISTLTDLKHPIAMPLKSLFVNHPRTGPHIEPLLSRLWPESIVTRLKQSWAKSPCRQVVAATGKAKP